jgi:hypothetical protein
MSDKKDWSSDINLASTIIADVLQFLPRSHWDKTLKRASKKADKKTITFYTKKIKSLCELTAQDVPRGLDPEDVATDCN